MIPTQCGASTHVLLGLSDPPSAGRVGSGVVICNPWGQEHTGSHRTIRFLARRLSSSGHHVLRFDYFGCGDSGGDSTDGGMDCWVQDTATAIEELKNLTGKPVVTLLGIRLGAMVASMTATRRTDVDRLVLWDPILDMSSYMGMLAAESRRTGVRIPMGWPESGNSPVVDLDGSQVTREMGRGMARAGMEPSTWRSVQSALLLASSRPLDDYSSLIGEAAKIGEGGDQSRAVTTREFPWPNLWSSTDDHMAGGVPLDAIEAVAEWLS